MLEQIKAFCEEQGWLIEDFIDNDFVWAEGFVIVNDNKRIIVEPQENAIHLETKTQKYIYKNFAQVKAGIMWIMRH